MMDRQKKPTLIAIAVVALFAIATLFLTRSGTTLQSASPVSGLVALKATAQEAIPYETALTNQKPTIIEFYANWCTTCQALAPTLQSVHHQFGEQVNFVMLNIDDPQWQEPVQQFHVNGVPYLALLNADRTVARTFVGKVPQQILAKQVTELLSLT